MNRKSVNKLIVSVLCANMMLTGMPVGALASEISGVTPTGHTYNIDAAKVSGHTGFRQYEKFNLDKGDIANLKFNNYSKFVNLVDNRININGIVNTMKGNDFYNGHAIFVSPNGMVIGASGFLNVGSLSVLTPSQSQYDLFKTNYSNNSLADYKYDADKYKELISTSDGSIVVNGKILARENVNLYGSDIKIGDGTNRAGIIAGWDDEDSTFTDLTAAQNAFNSLVSNNIKNADSFGLSDGVIQIVANKESKSGGAAGNIKANIDIKKADIGAGEIEISSKAEVERQERIDLAEANVNVEDSNITGDTLVITAESKQNKKFDAANPLDDVAFIKNTFLDIFSGDTPSVTSLWGVAGKASADVTVKNSTLTALKAQGATLDDGNPNPQKDASVYIHAEASSETSENANFLTPAIIDIIKNDDAKIGEFFSSGIYNGFEGARSSATVNVENSTINANADTSKNVEISSEASSTLDANNRILALIMPVGLYGVGTETVAKAVVTGSTLNVTNGDVDVNAVSSNSNAVNLTNDSVVSYTLEDGLLAMLLNNTVKTTTEASVISSAVNANNLTVLAANLSESESEIGMEAKAGTTPAPGGNGQGNSAASIVGILNRSDNHITSLVKDSTVRTKENTTVLAQSLNKTLNTADATVTDEMTENPKTFDQTVRDKLKSVKNEYLNKTLFEKIKGNTSVTANQSATAEAGGVLIWNNTNNTTTAKIENSDVEADDVTVQANTVELLANGATSDAAGEGKFGVGLSVIYNEQHNTTNANVSGSTIKANNVTVDATTELPMNQGKLTFGLKLPFKICGVEKIFFGGGFASEANGKWDFSFIHTKPEKEDGEPDFELTGIAEQNIKDNYEDLKPKFRLEGFFNNFAQSAANGTNAAISGSIVYNGIVNNTTADITDNSSITIYEAEDDNPQGALTVNAVNSVIGYNAAGLIDFLVKQINYKIPGQPDEEYEPTFEAGRFGLGVNLFWDNYTNNATAKIDNSTVLAEKGAVNVDAATEQSYLSANMTGAKSEAFGIDGSINVQKIKGDLISNIANENEIRAMDVSVNAGNAHVKTTAGVIKRDDETNQIVWKVQDPSAQGDDQYVREAKDQITNIILQGAWVAQSEEVNNTVQANSGGVAIGTSLTVSDVDRSVKASIENSTVTSANDLSVNADTYNQKIDVEVAAAFSGGVTQKAAEVENAEADVDAAHDDEDDNIFGNLFDNEDEYMKNPVGNKLSELQGQFSMSIAGAVDVSTDSTKVEASISNSTVNAGNSLEVKANRESKNINFDGGLGKSKKVGAGAAVNYFKQEGSVKSFIDNSTITFSGDTPTMDLAAINKNWILDIAVGAGAAVNSAEEGQGFQAAIGGSASINTLKPTIEAYINGSTIKCAENNNDKIDTKLEAKNDVDIIAISGGGSYVHGGTSGLSAGAALNYNNIKNTISTYIKDSTLDNIGNLTMLSDADNNFNSFAIAGAIVTGTDSGFNFNFAGSADIDFVHDTISSKIINSTITANDDIEVQANSKSENFVVAGTIDFTTAQSGAGVNGDVSINVYRNDITSEIDKDSKILKANDVKVSATSTEKSNVIPVGAAVATGSQYLMAAANIGVNVIDNSVKAYASGNIGSGEGAENINNLTVSAYDETTLYTRGGTIALASADSVANLAASVNVDKIDKTVEAKIKDADVKANGDVSVLANSINSLGGTKNDEGGYTRDDVTTDSYKERMFKKNDDGEYDDLKLGNSFLNWNMFYNVSAGAHVSVGGAGIGKVIENAVTAQIDNSEIEADNLSVAARDYSVKNIIAGSISASAKAAAGLQALYTRDNSTTYAMITNGSKLTVADTLEMLANNVKDSYEIMIAGSGAGKGVINANIVVNNITDKAIAKIDNNSTGNEIKAGTLTINSNEDINSSHIVAAAGGATGLALSVAPLVNNYNMTTESVIANAKIKDAAIDMDAQSKLGTLDISVGVAGVGKGLAGTGVAIKNNYTNTVKSYINGSVIDTTKAIDIDANSIIKSNNWLASLSVAGQGISIVTNVLLNNVISTLEAGIKNSTIENAGAITINTNKNKKDDISNKAIGLGAAGQGASALVNVVQNIYKNTVNSYVDNTSSTTIDSLTVNSSSDRKLENINLGISFAGMGASLLANALVNQIDSSTSSVINVQDKTLNVANALAIDVKDNTTAYNTMGMINGAAEGAAAGANINLYYANNIAEAEVKSSESGRVNAGSSDIHSTMVNGLDNSNIGVSIGGFGAIAGDVAVIKLGKRTATYSQAEQESKIKESVDFTKDKYDKITADDADNVKNLYTPTSSPADIKTGAIASVNGNLKTTNDTAIKAESKLKGLGNDEKLTLTNVNVSAGLGVVGVGVKNVQLANNTLAEISGGNVESKSGKVSVNAETMANVEIKNTKVEVSGLTISGGGSVYNNTSETVAQIKDATVNTAGDIDVVSKSTSKSLLDSTNVVVTGDQIVAVDLAEATDTNKSVALITGNTNIDAAGKLNVHSTVNTDLSSVKSTVTVAGAGIVSVSKNEVRANTIGKAIIENVNGTIKTNGLDIITDYDMMFAYSKANVTSVKLGDVASVDSSGAYMNANFKSGIDSLSGLIINNTGATNITTAKDNGTEGIVAKGEIHNVHVSLQGFVATTSAKSENTAASSTVLKAHEHTANSMNINSYLNSTAVSNAGATKVTVGIGVNAVSVDAKDTSTMSVDIGGSNTITQHAIINATHTAGVNSDLSAFNFGGLIGGGQRVRIDSNLVANTTGNIGGDFNANSASITFNTTRNAVMSKSSGSGAGILNIGDVYASNLLKGDSVLNISALNTDTGKGINKFTIRNASTNIFDVTSSNGAGGFISINADRMKTEFDSGTTTNILNANINSDDQVTFGVENNSVIKDTASIGGGGFVAINYASTDNTYGTKAKLLIKDSNINAKNIGLKSQANTRTAQGGYVDYAGGAGGFVASDVINISNTINQTSEIQIQNSLLHAKKDIVASAITLASFKEKVDTTVGGFTAIPRSRAWITVTNNNIINVDSSSKLKASDELEINFNSDNALEARATSEAHHFGFKDPVAESYVSLTVNNTLQNNGSIEAGNLVDINYMTNSTNNLTQYAYAEAHAAIPTTTEDGKLTKHINNTLQVGAGADITSGKDVEITYSAGKGSESSYINYKSVCYALFGIPITKNGTPKSKLDVVHTPKLELDGEIVAGQSNSKYMKINRDGTIDKETLKGFYDDDYVLSDGEIIPGSDIKQKILDSINIEIENLEESIEEAEAEIVGLDAKIGDIDTELTEMRAQLDEIDGLIDNGYKLKSTNDFYTIVTDAVKVLVVNDATAPVSDADFATIAAAYDAVIDEIDAYNEANPALPKNIPTMTEFFDNINNYDSSIVSDADKAVINGLSTNQKTTIQNAFYTVASRLDITEKGEFTVYVYGNDKYIEATNPTVVASRPTCDEIIDLTNSITKKEDYKAPLADRKAVLNADITAFSDKKSDMQDRYTEVEQTPDSEYEKKSGEYSIVFNDIYAASSHINVSGAYSTNIFPQGSAGGKFSVASPGLKVDNYSTRTLVFNDISLGDQVQSGLIINGKNFSEFADKDQAVSGWDAFNYIYNMPGHKAFSNLETNGVHYISNSGGISGITVNNYYDINHPFASTWTDIPFSTEKSNVYIIGDISTDGDLKIWNESGDIGIFAADTLETDNDQNVLGITDNDIKVNNMSLISTNGRVTLVIYDISTETTTPEPFHIKPDDYIFARDGFSMMVDREVDIQGPIKTGYSERSLTITDDMIKPENLILDNTSGETNMINLGGTNISPYLNATNNIKAIYKDGQIYLYNVPELSPNNGVAIVDTQGTRVSMSGNGYLTIADGYQNIAIDNQTSSQLNVNEISNTKFTGIIADTIQDAYPDRITRNTLDNANTTINSVGKLSLNGIIRNNVDNGPLYHIYDGGTLNIAANNGLDVKKQIRLVDNVPTVVDSIYAGGLVDITVNGGETLISGNITDKGDINIYNFGNDKVDINGDITDNAGNINIQNDGAGKLSINGEIVDLEGDISILGTGSGVTELTNAIYAELGDIDVVSKGLTATQDSVITDKKGNVSVTNNAGSLDLEGLIIAQDGNLSVHNNGTSATVAGAIRDEKGDLTIINTNGDMTISSNIYHNYLNTNSEGMISIINTPDAGAIDIQSSIQTWGKGKTEQDLITGEEKTTAILIDNSSTTKGMSISNGVSARIGDIIIKNATDDLTVAGLVSVSEHGDISILNAGDDLQTSANAEIFNQKGNVSISNTGTTGKTLIGGKIDNQDGNTSLSSNGIILEVSGTVNNSNGNIDMTNTNGQLRIVGDVANKGGDITASNTGSYTEITGSITNETLSITQDEQTITKSGNINLSNENGNFRILEGAEITNTSDSAETGILVTNFGDDFQMAGNISSLDKGDIEITNTGNGYTTISGNVSAKSGDIDISNSVSSKKLTMSGNITDENGNIDITNDSTDGTSVSGKVTNVKGDTTIVNNAGDLEITSTAEITNTESGNIDVDNKGGKFTIAGLLKHSGLGNIFAKNTGDKELEIASTGIVEATDGDINITNDSAAGTSVSGKVTNVKGDTIIVNNAGDLEFTSTSEVTNTESGNIDIENKGGKFTIAGLLKHFGLGNIFAKNTGDKELEIASTGIVAATDGDINITNDSAAGTSVSGKVTNVKGDTTIVNNAGDLEFTSTSEVTNTESGNIDVDNKGGKFTIAGLLKHFGLGNIFTNNTGDKELQIAETGVVNTANGNIDVQNSNTGGVEIGGYIGSDKGKTDITNTAEEGIKIATTGAVHNKDGNITISNTNTTDNGAGIDVQGIVQADKQNIRINNTGADLTIGEYESSNDNYINAVTGNVTINQKNGNIINNITDPDASKTHQNVDKGNPEQGYKTLIAAGNDLTIIAKDGDIGSTSNSNPGFSIDAKTRDYTESLNVNVKGNVTARTINENNTDKRLVNIRAKESGLKIKDVTSDGNVMLTAADWKQADVRPTPDDKAYFRGYSVLNAAEDGKSAVTGQNISVISSNNIGTEAKPLSYTQDTKNEPNSSVSIEAENNIHLSGKSNSKNEAKINQLISKNGTIDFTLESDAAIGTITSGGGLKITQKAQNLTIYDIGGQSSAHGGSKLGFDDILYPHDDLVVGKSADASSSSVIPKYINIKVLDAIDNPNRGESNLKIYTAYVRGNNGDNAHYYADGSRLADVTLMADNIYANSAKAPDSTVSTKAYPNGYKQTDKTFTDEVFGGDGSVVYEAQGINAYGEGTELSLDIIGVDPDIVKDIVSKPNRNLYAEQRSVLDTPAKFLNDKDRVPFYNVDYKADMAVVSVNDYVNTNRGVSVDTIYANNSYINTSDTNLKVGDGYITNYAEFRNRDKIAVVDNDFRRIVKPADIQLYTQKTGSFNLTLDDSINMHTSAPTVYNEPHMLVNGYHSAWSFVNRGFKENKDLIDNTQMVYDIDKNNYDEPSKRISMRFDTTKDSEFCSDVVIYDISTTGALIRNDKKLKRGKKTTVKFKFDDVDIKVKAKVVSTEGNKAGIKFLDMPEDVANKILYRFMQQADSMKTNLTTSR